MIARKMVTHPRAWCLVGLMYAAWYLLGLPVLGLYFSAYPRKYAERELTCIPYSRIFALGDSRFVLVDQRTGHLQCYESDGTFVRGWTATSWESFPTTIMEVTCVGQEAFVRVRREDIVSVLNDDLQVVETRVMPWVEGRDMAWAELGDSALGNVTVLGDGTQLRLVGGGVWGWYRVDAIHLGASHSIVRAPWYAFIHSGFSVACVELLIFAFVYTKGERARAEARDLEADESDTDTS